MDFFQSCGHCWVFQICCHIEWSTFTALSFRIWNSLTGIPSPPPALFIVILPKAHLTSHSRTSGSRWVITPSWLSVSSRSFLYSFSVYSCHLFLISYAFVRTIPFLSFIEPIFAWKFPLVSLIFLKRSLIFPILLFSANSFHWTLRKPFLSLLASLCNSAFKWEYLSFSPLLFTSLLFKRLFLKLTRYPMLRYLALFYLWVNARVWAHWNHSFPMHLRYPGPHFYVLYCFSHPGVPWASL